VLGWRALLPEAISGRLSSIPGAVSHLPALALFILAAVIPWGLIAPAYRLPQLITALPREVTPVDFRFGDSMRLVGYSIDADLHPREIATVKLCWESLAATSVNYTVSVALLGRQLAPVAKLDSIPGNGNYPTSIWVPGRLFCDSYPLTLPPVVERPALGRIAVAAYEFDGDTKTIKDYLPIFNSQSDPVSAAIMGRVKLYSDAAQASQHECVTNLSNRSAVYSFPQEGIQLFVAVDRSEADEVNVAMCWLAQGRPSRAYTAFVHLTPQNAPGTLLMQADGEPGQGDYPTDLWESGDQVSDVRQLSIASDTKLALVVEIGLYDLETGERLVVLGADQTVLPGNFIRLVVPEDN
jgi:hypothetical protein